MTADQAIILRIFEGLGGVPGRFIPVKTLLLNWAPSRSNADFADALEALAANQIVQPNADATAYALTHAQPPR